MWERPLEILRNSFGLSPFTESEALGVVSEEELSFLRQLGLVVENDGRLQLRLLLGDEQGISRALEPLRQNFGCYPFTIEQAAAVLPDDLKPAAKQVMNELLLNGKIAKVGDGVGKVYMDLPVERSEHPTAFETAMGVVQKYGCELLLDEVSDRSYLAAVDLGGRVLNLYLLGREFRTWLNAVHCRETGKGLREEVRNQVRDTLEGLARSQGRRLALELLTKVNEERREILVDLQNGRCVRILPGAWAVQSPPYPFPFYRSEGIGSFPEPAANADPSVLDLLVPTNIEPDRSEDLSLLVKVWVCTCLLSHIARPVLLFVGPHGSAKTTACRKICYALFGKEPVMPEFDSDPRGFFVAAHCSPLLILDNLSQIDEGLARMVSTAVTGTQALMRQLYTNLEPELTAPYKRAVLMNGISPNVGRYPDLMDRCLVVRLKRLGREELREETKILKEVTDSRPKILGAVFKVLSKALEVLPEVRAELLERKLIVHRLADWVIWAEAASRSLGYEPLRFLQAYARAREEQNFALLEENPVGKCILALAEELREEQLIPEDDVLSGKRVPELPYRAKDIWIGSPSQLLDALQSLSIEQRVLEELPKAPHVLVRRLKEIEADLQDRGIHIFFRRTGRSGRFITIKIAGDGSDGDAILLPPTPRSVLFKKKEREEGGAGGNNIGGSVTCVTGRHPDQQHADDLGAQHPQRADEAGLPDEVPVRFVAGLPKIAVGVEGGRPVFRGPWEPGAIDTLPKEVALQLQRKGLVQILKEGGTDDP